MCLFPLTNYSHKVLTLCFTVIPITGFFKNITPKKGEDLLYSVCMIHIFVSLNFEKIFYYCYYLDPFNCLKPSGNYTYHLL